MAKKAEKKEKKTIDGPSKKDWRGQTYVGIDSAIPEVSRDLDVENLGWFSRLLLKIALRKELKDLDTVSLEETKETPVSTSATSQKGRRIVRLRFNPGPA